MESSIRRLSSGSRINSAKDDAAGLAMVVALDASVRGQRIAQRNANDAISYAQVADGALSSIAGILQRMRELALQGANESNNRKDHLSLNTEFVQLQSEITQITTSTDFNGISIFNGTAISFKIDGSAQADSQISFQGTDLTTTTSKTGFAAFINNGISLATVNDETASFIAAGGSFNTSDGSPTGFGAGSLNATIASFENNMTAADLTAFQNQKAAFIGAGGSFSASDGSAAMAKSGTQTVIINPGPSQTTQQVPVSTLADVNNYNAYTSALSDYYAAAKGIQILDSLSAFVAIRIIDDAINEVTQERNKYGAFQNVLTGIVSNLDSLVENQTAAISRIADTDFAAETMTLAKQKILHQAGMAVLTQANLSPRLALVLLGGNL